MKCSAKVNEVIEVEMFLDNSFRDQRFLMRWSVVKILHSCNA